MCGNCRVSNPTTIHYKINITISELPIEFIKQLSNQEVEETEDAVFTCQLSKPNQEVTWKINGKPVTPSDKYIIQCQDNVYTLTIKNCQLDDTSDITVVTKDGKSDAHLIVIGMKKPSFLSV